MGLLRDMVIRRINFCTSVFSPLVPDFLFLIQKCWNNLGVRHLPKNFRKKNVGYAYWHVQVLKCAIRQLYNVHDLDQSRDDHEPGSGRAVSKNWLLVGLGQILSQKIVSKIRYFGIK